MPGHLVFPGGKLETSDAHLAADLCRRASFARRTATTSSPAPLRDIALVLAAIRETFEETGVMICEPARFRSRAPFWRDFAQRGVRPANRQLVPMARAVAPEGFVRRYDTRFFLVSRGYAMQAIATPPTDEFDMVEWMTADEAACFPLIEVTRAVLAQAAAWIETGRFDRFRHPLTRLRPHVGSTFGEQAPRWT
ncbi:NUDIX domain-containing protein [Aureimonas pseudogalii]